MRRGGGTDIELFSVHAAGGEGGMRSKDWREMLHLCNLTNTKTFEYAMGKRAIFLRPYATDAGNTAAAGKAAAAPEEALF